MNGRKARRAVLLVSIAVALVSFALWGYRRARGLSIPLWDQVGMAYGGVFCLFWFFDEIGRQASARREARASRRPRPAPPATPGQRVAITPGQPARPSGAPVARAPQPTVRLERVRPDQDELLQAWLDALAEEVWALEGQRPKPGPDGHPEGWSAPRWRAEGAHVFWMVAADGNGQGDAAPVAVGVLAVAQAEDALEIRGIYVAPAWRRLGVGGAALAQGLEFARLANLGPAVRVGLSGNNLRAQRFFAKHGFVPMGLTTEGMEEPACASEAARAPGEALEPAGAEEPFPGWRVWVRDVGAPSVTPARSGALAPPGATPG
ncbi:GNAT family N-acetyltransferase [Alicyclobacillus sp.]|uniref:GNAT family N-acetyltransferase n=1 Tax=Alicyclobacillus sp. TaxID=61169 RepID=UPI0025C427FC|nr:GNAT family N-acetyltransferase [Alicyclobacillus sp.]MCL6516722.1 GNAT family N-acetyltransferase [Alicyclobacillus sp.]